jgi:hypothetical protein
MSTRGTVRNETPESTNWRLWFGGAGAFALLLGLRLPFTSADTPLHAWWPLLVLGGGLVLWLVWMSRPARRSVRRGPIRHVHGAAAEMWTAGPRGSAVTMRRWSERSRRNEGLASWWSIWRVASCWAMRRQAKVLRPSLARRWWIRAIEVAQPIAQVGWLRIWSPCEDVTLRVGGPRTGKSGELACRILDAQGAVIATSTRTDLYDTCAPVLRTDRSRRWVSFYGLGVSLLWAEAALWLDAPVWLALLTALVALVPMSVLFGMPPRQGRPVYVFNPSGLGGLDSTVVFDPLVGCQDPVTATHRAGDLLAGSSRAGGAGSAEREHWVSQGRRVLAALMHAAALGGASMRDVLGWVADPGSGEQDILLYLRLSPEPSAVQDARQFLDTNDRTRSSITTTIMPALAWLADPGAWAATRPAADGSRTQLDIAALVELRGAVFLIGAEEAQTAPLVTALTGYIAREGRRLAALCPSGRLDPGLELVLDEAALICPVPLDKWTADMGGRNIGIHIGVQSTAQLVDRFGHAAAESILTNAGSILIFGGTRSRDDLNTYATLLGEREAEHHSWDHAGRLHSVSTRTVPVLSPALISQLPARHVVIIRRGMSPMIGRVQMAWKRGEVKAAKRAARWARRAVVVGRWTGRTGTRIRRLSVAFAAGSCRAWAGSRRVAVAVVGRVGEVLVELRWQVARLAERVGRRRGGWLGRVAGETREQRRVRRRIEAAQRRARKRGL